MVRGSLTGKVGIPPGGLYAEACGGYPVWAHLREPLAAPEGPAQAPQQHGGQSCWALGQRDTRGHELRRQEEEGEEGEEEGGRRGRRGKLTLPFSKPSGAQ